MKSLRRKVISILTGLMVFLMLTACSGGTAAVTWETSRTKQYYESCGVTGQDISLQATVSTSGQQGEYFFTRNEEFAYAETRIANLNAKILTDTEGNVYAAQTGYDGWTKYAAGSPNSQTTKLVWAGHLFVIPTAEIVESVTSEKVIRKETEYTAETIRMSVNGTPANYTYYYGKNGLEFVESSEARFKITRLSGVPATEYLKTPAKWHLGG